MNLRGCFRQPDARRHSEQRCAHAFGRALRLESLESRDLLSAGLQVGDLVRVVGHNLNVRTAPTTAAAEIVDSDYRGYASPGTTGRVLTGPATANGYTWYKVDYGPGLFQGWSADNWLAKQAAMPNVTAPVAPLLIKPGAQSGPGTRLTDTTVTFRWNTVPGATSYGFYLRDVTTGYLIEDRILPASQTAFVRTLVDGHQYRWNMQAFRDSTASEFSQRLYFQVAPVTATPSISGVSPSEPQATDGQQDFTIYGSNFDGAAYVSLYDNGGQLHKLSGERILSSSSTQITVDPNFTSDGVGMWQAEVVNGSGQSSGRYAFQVAAVQFIAKDTESRTSLNLPQRNNNPLNIKYGTATEHWVDEGLATLGGAATDGGQFLHFNDIETGFQAARELLCSNVYANSEVDAALRKWSGGGYGAEVVPELAGKRIGELTDDQLSNLIDSMARREGFYANGYVPPGSKTDTGGKTPSPPSWNEISPFNERDLPADPICTSTMGEEEQLHIKQPAAATKAVSWGTEEVQGVAAAGDSDASATTDSDSFPATVPLKSASAVLPSSISSTAEELGQIVEHAGTTALSLSMKNVTSPATIACAGSSASNTHLVSACLNAGQQFTFEQEGFREGLYHPTLSSGVTIGAGYDMKERGPDEIVADLVAAGVDENTASSLSEAAGLTGKAADDSVRSNYALTITDEQGMALFQSSYDEKSNYARYLATKDDVVKTYGYTDWSTLNGKIKDVLIDMTYRGDYTPHARTIIQSCVVRNDLNGFTMALSNRADWSGVPEGRFQARVEYLGAEAPLVQQKPLSPPSWQEVRPASPVDQLYSLFPSWWDEVIDDLHVPSWHEVCTDSAEFWGRILDLARI